MNNKVQNLSVSVTADILSAADFGASNFVASLGSELLTKLFRDRAEKSRDIALNEMAKCKRSELDIASADQFVAIVYRYQRAALEGAAYLNLSILAKIMKGQTTEGSVYASEFSEFAEVVSSLKTKEVVYLGTLIRMHKEKKLVKKEDGDDYYGLNQSVGIAITKQLVGTVHFPEIRDLISCESSLQRTSLIYPSLTTMDGSTIFSPTSELERLANLVEFEEVLGEINA